MTEHDANGAAALDRALAAIGRQDGLDLKLNDDGVCLMEMDGSVPLVLELTGDSDDRALCHVVLGPLSDDYHERYQAFHDALQCNLRLPALDGGVVALDPDGGMLVYTVSLGLDGLASDSLRRWISDACATAAELRGVIGLALKPEAADDSGEP